jgi:leader peptidase (prepilin peptidase) / N-methyltransferase
VNAIAPNDRGDIRRAWPAVPARPSRVAGAVAGVCAVAGLGGVALVSVSAVVWLALLGGGAVAAVSDVRRRRIPDGVVGALLATAAVAATVEAVTGRPCWGSVLGGLALGGGPLLALHLVNPDGMGFGDVKFAAAAGALLGVAHWALAGAMSMLAGVLGSLAALVVLPWRRTMPFGLFLALGALIAFACRASIVARFDPLGAR